MEKRSKHNISVLFVEDNDTIRFLYNRLLSKKVSSFYIGENGQHGLELYKQHLPELIITDISMPIMDGLEMISHVKEINPDVKVIVMSAYSIKEYFLEAINLGVNGYLIKPVEASKLFDLIDELAGNILMKRELEEKEQKRRIAEENLKRSLTEKDVLLKEVHHRVKNNMQIISSILKMQERQVDDERLKTVLGESQNRIRTMALIHENLYRNDNLANIQFLNYVKSLAGNLSRSYADKQGMIRFEYDMVDVFLPLDTGIPCGLIINELISNSIKYAFDGRDQGTIAIKLTRTNEHDNEFVLQVSDNGKGISKDFDIENTKSLGMKIVTRLVQQIDGTLKYDFENGTKFIIKFKI
ncbi:MAG: histidine kinase dimerization/phosphoacceptor domain -containing protein [Bacteroidales bacterium]